MPEYLVRWKFGPNSLLNPTNLYTEWYQQFHKDMGAAMAHHASLEYNNSAAFAMTVEVFELTRIISDETNDERPMTVDELVDAIPEKSDYQMSLDERNTKIVEMYDRGHTRSYIANKLGISYQTVYGVTRKYTD